MDSWWLYIIVGLVCGIFSATFGVGSGIILIPTLVLLFSFPQKSAQGVCLAVMVPMALAGAIRYKLNPDIEINLTAASLLALGGVLGALLGSSIAAWTPAPVLRKLFALIMIVAAVRMLITSPPPKNPASDQSSRQTTATTDDNEPENPTE